MRWVCALGFALASGCTGSTGEDTSDGAPPLANVVDVEVLGEPGTYTFNVTIRSPDTGCEQYADWWEVLRTEPEPGPALVHRRILAHSHVDEQPFTRGSGPVAVEGPDPIIVRAHLAPGGYGGEVFSGTVEAGLSAARLDADYAADLETSGPQPDDCAF